MRADFRWSALAFSLGLMVGVSIAVLIHKYGGIPLHQMLLDGSSVRNFVHWFNKGYRNHRGEFVAGAGAAARLRDSALAGTVGLIVFLIVSLPKNATAIRALFTTMINQHTIPLYKKLGVSNDDQPYARTLVFFYCLFLLYQIVSFPLTRWNPSLVAFYSDLFFQTVLIALIVRSYWRLKSHFRQKAKDAEHEEKLSTWLNSKLGDMDLTARSLFWVPVSTFGVAFGPALIVHLPSMLDALVQTDRNLIADLAFTISPFA